MEVNRPAPTSDLSWGELLAVKGRRGRRPRTGGSAPHFNSPTGWSSRRTGASFPSYRSSRRNRNSPAHTRSHHTRARRSIHATRRHSSGRDRPGLAFPGRSLALRPSLDCPRGSHSRHRSFGHRSMNVLPLGHVLWPIQPPGLTKRALQPVPTRAPSICSIWTCSMC